jgi:hypothetical protein
VGADPSNPQSWNGYSYVLNNPLSLVDPSGLDVCSDGSYADACVTASPDPVSTDWSWWFSRWLGGWGGGLPTFSVTHTESLPTPPRTLQQPPKNQTCPSAPAHPANYPPQALYNLGVNASKSVYDNLSPDLAKTLAYAALVAPNQPLDFKDQPSPGANPQYRAYGNFAFGVFGYSLGFSSTYIKWGAGVESYANTLAHFKMPPSSWGTPITGAPYGDSPLEQKEIQSGYQWAQMYAAGKCQ